MHEALIRHIAGIAEYEIVAFWIIAKQRICVVIGVTKIVTFYEISSLS